MAAGESVLITGYPSWLARTVCAEVLRTDEFASVQALLRPSEAGAAQAALDELPETHRPRVALAFGDAAAIDFGLSGAEYKALARKVTRIHHCAQVTHPSADRKAAARINVGAAHEAIEFATSCSALECLVFYSTAHVAGDRTGVVREDDLKAGQSFRNVVEETKAHAEKLVRAAMSHVPVAVVRPSTVVGDSRTGEVDRFDGPSLLILLVVTSPPDFALPLPGRGDERLNLVPIDWVVRASVAIGRDPRAIGRIFHLVDPRPPTARQFFELVARAGGRPGPRGSIPANLAKALLRAPGLERIANGPRGLLDELTTSVVYDARNADELLSSLRVGDCPPLETYVDKLVEYVQEHVRKRRTARRDASVESDDRHV
jgi:thioester reductase-like protein